MTFKPINDVEELLWSAANDAAAWPAFYRALLHHDLFFVTEDQMPQREQRSGALQAGTVQVRFIEFDGKPHVPIFTSPERVSECFNRDVGCMGAKGEAILSRFLGNELVLNPGSECGKVFTQQESRHILDGSIFRPRVLDNIDGSKMLMGQPKEYPRHLTDVLSRLFARFHEVKAAYLAHVFIAGVDKQAHAVIGLEAAGDASKVIEEAGVVVRCVARPGETVDLVQIAPNATNEPGSYMQRRTKPFYKRRKWPSLF